MGRIIEHLDIDCGHCGKAASMEVAAKHNEVSEVQEEFEDPHGEGYIYRMCICPSCRKITLVEEYINTRSTPSSLGTSIIFPRMVSAPAGLPLQIERAHSAAAKVRSVDANAYAVLLGRVLDLVCQDRKAEGDTLNAKIRNLADRGEIPKNLLPVAHSLRNLRNLGAHADLGELTLDEVPVLDDLCRAILEYVYTGPLLVQKAEQHLARLKSG
jgi:hypothetical protein